MRVDAAWRDPKRQRDSSWRGGASESAAAFSSYKYSKLQSSLKLLCSFDDLVLRMRFYLSLGSCQEVFDSMNQVVKVRISCDFMKVFSYALFRFSSFTCYFVNVDIVAEIYCLCCFFGEVIMLEMVSSFHFFC